MEACKQLQYKKDNSDICFLGRLYREGQGQHEARESNRKGQSIRQYLRGGARCGYPERWKRVGKSDREALLAEEQSIKGTAVWQSLVN